MEITRDQFKVKFRFEKKDWQINDGQACRDFIVELKELIAPEHRNYFSPTNTWEINHSFAHVVEDLRTKYFVDPNQPQLFG